MTDLYLSEAVDSRPMMGTLATALPTESCLPGNKKTPRELRPKSHPLGVIRHLNSGPGGPFFSWQAVVSLDSPAPVRSHPRSSEGERIQRGYPTSSSRSPLISRACSLISRSGMGFEVRGPRFEVIRNFSRKVTNHSRNLGSQTRPRARIHGLHCRSCLEGNLEAPHERRETFERACGSTRKRRTAVSPAGSERIEPAGDLRVVEPRERQPTAFGLRESPGDGGRRQRSSEQCRSPT